MPAVTTWKADVHHLLHTCHVYMEGRCAPSATCVPCAMEVWTKCRHRSSREVIMETFLYTMHTVKLQRCSFMTLYVSSMRKTCTLHTLMDFAKASRWNEANRTYDQWKLELSHMSSSKKPTTPALLQGTRTQRGQCNLLLSVLLHMPHRSGGIVKAGKISASVQIVTLLDKHCQFRTTSS